MSFFSIFLNPSLYYFFVISYVGQWLCEVERFDPLTNQWALIEPMHHSRTGVAVTALKGMIVLFPKINNNYAKVPHKVCHFFQFIVN